MKFFVLSLHRVATQSTHNLLVQWKLRAVHHPKTHSGVDLRESVVGHELDLDYVFARLKPVYDDFDAVSDVPTMVLYPQLAAAYPNAKFILIDRDPQAWARSVRRLMGSDDFPRFDRVLYWQYFRDRPRSIAQLTDTQLARMHRQHTQEVSDFFFSTPSRLGLFHLDDPDLAQGLSRFTGMQSLPFPNEDRHREVGLGS